MGIKFEKVTFPGHSGGNLAARLDLPAGKPRAYALFAHCFTCSKDVFAASRISTQLATRGFAVLRFDFTGLGASDGEFENTNFSSNVQDLIAAVDFLRTNHRAPEILIGHSLGGAAVLAAAGEIPEVKAVATIGAPADTEHVIDNFHAKIDEIESKGEAQVYLAGRPFKIRKQFLDDVRQTSLNDKIARLNKALLVAHAPRDEVVGIENAARIFVAAKHPKSFISLDDADHLLSERSDAVYIAEVIAAWAANYIADAQPDAQDRPEDGVVRSRETGMGAFQQDILVARHHLLADEPKSVGGDGTGPGPYDYLSAALAACTSMTIRMYANRKKIALEHVSVDVTHDKVHAKDCEDCVQTEAGGKVDVFERRIELTGQLDEQTREKLREIADKCPVHRTLEAQATIRTHLKS